MSAASSSTGLVGIDYWPAVAHAPGVGRYVRELVRAAVALADRPALALFDVGPGKAALPESALGLCARDPGAAALRRVRARLPRRLFGARAAALGLGADRWLGFPRVFHRAFPELPRTSRALEVLPVADLPGEREPAQAELARALARARAVIAMSAATGAALSARFDVDPARIALIPVGCDHWVRERPPGPPQSGRLRFLVLGAQRRERRPLAIAAAVAALVDGGLDAELAFVGRRGPGTAALAGSRAARRLGARLALVEPLERELPERVARSDVLVHLNASEGTPVTPLEACAFGCAVVATRLAAFEEALGSGAIWVEREERAELGGPEPERDAALEEALSQAARSARDEAERAVRRALAAPFTWRRHARLTVDLWNGILAESPGPAGRQAASGGSR